MTGPATSNPPASRWRATVLTPAVILIGLLAYYVLIFQSYRPYDIDNPWFLSFSYNACVEHISSDQFMDMRFPAGMDGTQLFGRLAALMQCTLLQHTGWQQRPALLLSSSLVVLALGCWWLQLRKLGFSTRFVACFLVTAGLSEPFIAAANKFRFEFLSFALVSIGLVLVAYEKPFLGMFIAALAVETEPAAVSGLIPIVILAYSTARPGRRLAAKLLAGLLLAMGVYSAFHPQILQIGTYLRQARGVGSGFDGGTLSVYFVSRARHWPELLFFLLAASVYIVHRRSFPLQYPAVSALALTFLFFALPHGNVAYMIFLYPFLIVMALLAFRVEQRLFVIVSCVLLFVLAQQLYLIRLTRGLGYSKADIDGVTQAIATEQTHLGIPDNTLRIYGDYRLWYAHPHLYRAASQHTAASIHNADLYLCFDRSPEPTELAPPTMLLCPDLTAALALRLVAALPVKHQQLFLYAPEQTTQR